MNTLAVKFEGSLEGVSQRVIRGLRDLGEPTTDGQISILGPFPVFLVDAFAFSQGRTRGSLRQSGWRGIALDQQQPIAIVDFGIREETGAMIQHSISVRGAEAAIALYSALQLAEASLGDLRKWNVCLVSLPRLFITAVWLFNRQSIYLPTRLGIGKRPKASLMSRADFISHVRAHLRRMTRVHSREKDLNRVFALNQGVAEAGNNPPSRGDG